MDRALHGARTGVNKSTVQRICSNNKIKPHRPETFRSSRVGYGALSRREESVPNTRAHTRPSYSAQGCGRAHMHDYICHGTITLLEAPTYLGGKIVSRTGESHTQVSWLRLLNRSPGKP
jgi:hypothetical protein